MSRVSPHPLAPVHGDAVRASYPLAGARRPARYGLHPKTAAKWRRRTTTEDAPMGPRVRRSTVLTPLEAAVVVEFRRRTLLPLDDVLGRLRETLPRLPRSALHRCLQRHDISRAHPLPGDLRRMGPGPHPVQAEPAPPHPGTEHLTRRAVCAMPTRDVHAAAANSESRLQRSCPALRQRASRIPRHRVEPHPGHPAIETPSLPLPLLAGRFTRASRAPLGLLRDSGRWAASSRLDRSTAR